MANRNNPMNVQLPPNCATRSAMRWPNVICSSNAALGSGGTSRWSKRSTAARSHLPIFRSVASISVAAVRGPDLPDDGTPPRLPNRAERHAPASLPHAIQMSGCIRPPVGSPRLREQYPRDERQGHTRALPAREPFAQHELRQDDGAGGREGDERGDEAQGGALPRVDVEEIGDHVGRPRPDDEIGRAHV